MISSRLRQCVVLSTLLIPSVALAEAPTALFVLDSSGSMNAKLEGKTKMEVARTVMGNLIKSLPANVGIGLETYGHTRKDDCNDIEMLVPVSSDRDAFMKAVNELDPKGSTPLTGAIRLAATQLREVEGTASVVVVSDGKETCGGDPCAAVREAVTQGVKMQVHVVGFDVTPDEAEQLRCIAKEGKGKYFAAANSNELVTALAEVSKEVIAPAAPEPKASETTLNISEVQPHDIDNPLPIKLEETSKITLTKKERSYFKISLPAGTSKIILDTRNAEGERMNLQSSLSILDQDGAPVKEDVIRFNEVDVDYRRVYTFSLETPTEVGLKLANNNDKTVFWLTVLKESDPAPLPLFGKVIPNPLTEGQSRSGTLNTYASAYYSVPLKKGNYKTLLDFTNSAGDNTNLQGYLAILDTDGGNQKEVIRMNEVDVSYRKTASFSIENDRTLIVRVENTNQPVKYSVKILPVAQE